MDGLATSYSDPPGRRVGGFGGFANERARDLAWVCRGARGGS